MNRAVLLLSLWAIAATKAGPLAPPPAPPVAPVAPAAPAVPTAPATPPAPKPPPVAAVDVIAAKYKISFKLANVKYADGLSSYDTALYQNYAGKIQKAIIDLYADNNAYREMKMIGFRNDTGVIADITLRFGNASKNLVSLDTVVKAGTLGTLPVDPASLQATKDDSVPPVAVPVGFGCGQPCGAPQQCFPSCTSDCCGSSGVPSFGMPPPMGQFGAPPMPPMQGMPPMPPMPMPPMAGGAGQCPGQCPSSCAPSCQQSCCGGAAGPMPPTMG